MINLDHTIATLPASKPNGRDQRLMPSPHSPANGQTFEGLFRRRRRSPATPLLPAPVSPHTILTWLDVVDEALCDLAMDASGWDEPNQAHMLVQAILSDHVPVAELLNSVTAHDGTFAPYRINPTSWLDVVDEAMAGLDMYAYTPLVQSTHMLIQDILNGHVPVGRLLSRIDDESVSPLYRWGVSENDILVAIERRLQKRQGSWSAPFDPLAIRVDSAPGTGHIRVNLYYQGEVTPADVATVLNTPPLPLPTVGVQVTIVPIQVGGQTIIAY